LSLTVSFVLGAAATSLFAGDKNPTSQPSPQRNVIINGTRLSDEALDEIATRWRVRIADGDYWYDRRSGAWGLTGGPTIGFVLPNLAFGGELRADASHGDTGVFINGRELHRLDVLALSQFVPVYQGRYWADASGWCGFEGDPTPRLNLAALVQQRLSVRNGGGGDGDGGYNRAITGGGGIGGDGNGNFYYIDSKCSASRM
jgi:hypothetical protein